MRGPKLLSITVTPRQHAVLSHLARCSSLPVALVQRSQLLLALAASTGLGNEQIARQLGLHRGTVRLWRARWYAAALALSTQEDADPDDGPLRAMIGDLLSDAPRSGAPPTFSAEQVVQVIALACEDPQICGYPISHWTPRELAAEAAKRGIVLSISPRSVGRFLGSGPTATPSQPLLAQSQAVRSRRVRRAGWGGV